MWRSVLKEEKVWPSRVGINMKNFLDSNKGILGLVCWAVEPLQAVEQDKYRAWLKGDYMTVVCTGMVNL